MKNWQFWLLYVTVLFGFAAIVSSTHDTHTETGRVAWKLDLILARGK